MIEVETEWIRRTKVWHAKRTFLKQFGDHVGLLHWNISVIHFDFQSKLTSPVADLPTRSKHQTVPPNYLHHAT